MLGMNRQTRREQQRFLRLFVRTRVGILSQGLLKEAPAPRTIAAVSAFHHTCTEGPATNPPRDERAARDSEPADGRLRVLLVDGDSSSGTRGCHTRISAPDDWCTSRELGGIA